VVGDPVDERVGGGAELLGRHGDDGTGSTTSIVHGRAGGRGAEAG
jgi:hypothetical protein